MLLIIITMQSPKYHTNIGLSQAKLLVSKSIGCDQLPLVLFLLTCWIFLAHGPIVGTSNSMYIYVIVLYLESSRPLRNRETINIVSLMAIYGVQTLKSARTQS